jgi:pimeloyl-ACP methyl ester carboxylesterase
VFGRIDERGDPAHPVLGADVVAVPYDFRRGITEAAERLDAVVCAHLGDASETERAGRVIVVGHSMGGLVARVWMGLLGRWPWCRALITLGTPHRGAPKALAWLVNGVPGAGRASRMLRTWPSVTQLLPRYPATFDVEAGCGRYPHELPVPWLTDSARAAYDLHVEIENSWDTMPRRGPETVACLGWSHATPNAMFWENDRLRVTKQLPGWFGLRGWEKDFGDGTVPAFSALPPEMDNHEHSPIRVRERHLPLSHTAAVADLLRRQLERDPPRQIHGAEDGEHPPTIGLDLDDIHAAGTPIGLSATLREVLADVAAQPVWARLRSLDRPGRVNTPLSWDPARAEFVGEFPGQAPGLYEIRVTARNVPDAGDLDATDVVAVVEGD